MRFNKFLVALDGSDESLAALETTIELGRVHAAQLVLLCVATLETLPESLRGVAELKLSATAAQGQPWPNLARLPSWIGEAIDVIKRQGSQQRVIDELAAQILEKARARAAAAGVEDIRLEQGSGDPAAEIVNRCRALDVDLVVVAPRHAGTGVLRPDSIADAVVRDCPCSCLVIKAAGKAGD